MSDFNKRMICLIILLAISVFCIVFLKRVGGIVLSLICWVFILFAASVEIVDKVVIKRRIKRVETDKNSPSFYPQKLVLGLFLIPYWKSVKDHTESPWVNTVDKAKQVLRSDKVDVQRRRKKFIENKRKKIRYFKVKI